MYSNIDFPGVDSISDFPSILYQYGSKFGFQNVVIIDYYGVLAANKDISYVFFCEIIGVFCDVQFSGEKTNLSADLISRQLAYLFTEFAFAHNCSYTDALHDMFVFNYRWNSNAMTNTHKLQLLRAESMNRDSFLRKQFNNIIIYGNASANLVVSKVFSVECFVNLFYFYILIGNTSGGS